jgi:hypothetical protein
MAWLGYNTQVSLEEVTKPTGGEYTATSRPITLSEVERYNTQQYYYINNVLRNKGVTVPVTDPEDVQELALINDWLTAEVVENIKYRNLQNMGNSLLGKAWGDLGRTHLKEFRNGKKEFSSNTTQSVFAGMIGNVYPDMEDEDPKSDIDYVW